MLVSLNEYKDALSEPITQILNTEIETAAKIADFLPEHLNYVKKMSVGEGKKIRGYLTYLGAHSFTDSVDEVMILKLAATLEIFHTAILILDDITDQSPKRRGLDAMHIYEIERLKSKHLGENVTSYFGMTGLFLTSYLFSTFNMPTDDLCVLNSVLSRIAIDLVYGQVSDILATTSIANQMSFENIINTCNLKTGTYTFLLPLQAGIIASGHREKIDTVKEFSRNAGITFQLTDDILDIYGDTTLTGKQSACSDMKEGKVNAITKLALNQANSKDKQFLQDILSNYQSESFDEQTIQKIQSVITSSGALDKTHELINLYTKEAESNLEQLAIRTETKDILLKILLSLKDRKK